MNPPTDRVAPGQVPGAGEELRTIEGLAAQMGRRADALMVDVDRQIRTRSRSVRSLMAIRAGLVDLASEADKLAARASSAANGAEGA